MADSSIWRPFPVNSQFLCKEGKTIGFRTRSGVVFGPEKIEVMPDVAAHRWMYRFIVHEYSVPLDFPASRKVQHNRARHDLDAYLWSLPDQIRSRCSQERVFKRLPFARYAMDVIFPPDCEFLKGEFVDREKF